VAVVVMVGFAAPKFDCRAVIDRVFDANRHAVKEPAELLPLNRAVSHIRKLWADVAVVCRAPVSELMAWPNRRRDEAIPFPLLVDADDRLHWLYNLILADGSTLWGQFLIDSHGFVRQRAVSSFPVAVNVDELVTPSGMCVRSGTGRLPPDRRVTFISQPMDDKGTLIQRRALNGLASVYFLTQSRIYL
jgi:hypothetical protein